MPDVAWPLLATRLVNEVLHTSYTVEQVQEFEPGMIEVFSALKASLPARGG
jgi:hypothetical protein